MSALVSPLVRTLAPYVPGEQCRDGDWVKLNTNESPFGPAGPVLQALKDAATDRLRLYPDPEASELRSAIACYFDLDVENVFVGNGSDEVLAHAFCAFFQQELPLLMPDVTYKFYDSMCRLYRIHRIQVPVAADWSINVDAYRTQNGGIVFANPNAPTGRLLPLAELERLLAIQSESVVLVDEAYIDFGGVSAAGLVRKHPNLVVVQTFSKSRGLAGLRVGFALASRDLIKALQRVKDSFNSYPLGHLAIAGALAAIRDTEFLAMVREQIVRNRELVSDALGQLGFHVVPSAANFVFAKHPAFTGQKLLQDLRERRVLVRRLEGPRTFDHLRITIGNQEQCERLLEELSTIVS